jgi:hypothetical protein
MEEKMADKDHLRGLAQINIGADDVGKVRDWYSQAFGGEAYFQRPDSDNPAYVEFRVGADYVWMGARTRRSLLRAQGFHWVQP